MNLFKNCVFKPSVDTTEWCKSTAVRCVRSAAFAAMTLIPATGATLGNVDWKLVASAAAAQVIITFITCLAGVPEVPAETSTKE